MRTPERQRQIVAMALIMGGEGFHYVLQEIQGIVDGYFRGAMQAETEQECFRACADARRVAGLWRDIKQQLKFITQEATKPKETSDVEIPTPVGRFSE